VIARRLIVGGITPFQLPPREPLAATGAAFDVASGGAYKAFPGLCVMPNGELLVAYRSGVTHTTEDGVLFGKISADGGETWGSAFTIYNPATDARDPSLTTLSDGRIACSFFLMASALGTGVYVTLSDDNGATWDTPIQMTDTFSVEVACSAPIVEVSGTLIQPIYGRNGADWDSAVLSSTDGGLTWGDQAAIATGTNDWTEPWIVMTAAGTLLCLIRVDDLAEIHTSESLDGGATWSTPALAFAGHSRASTFKASSGTLFTLYRKTAGDPDGLYRNSLDDGVTWDAATLWTSASFQYAAMAEFPSGRKVAVWAQEASGSDADIYLSEIA
jgi:Neuraminidase (sialidase)